LLQENRHEDKDSDQENKNTAERATEADKATAPSSQPATTAQSPVGSSHPQTVYYGGSGQAEVRYQDQVRAAIHANRIYPRQARRLKMEGESVVRLEVMRNGHIKSYRFVKSTGHHVLDKAVEEIIKSSDPLPNVPASIQKVPVTINLPLGFKLQQ
jgi:protein TonB